MSSGLYTFRSRSSKTKTPSGTNDNTTSSTTPTQKSKSKSKSASSFTSKPKAKSKSSPSKSSSKTNPSKPQQQHEVGDPVSSELSDNSLDYELKVDDGKFKEVISESSEGVEPSEEEDYDDTPVIKKYKKKVGSGSKRGPYKKRLSVSKESEGIRPNNAPQAVQELMPPPNYSLLIEVKTPTLEYILKHFHAVLQEARVEATRDESKQLRSQQAVEQLISTLDTGFEAAFCLTMNRYSAFCTVVDIPAFPITYPKVALHFARVLPTPLGSEFRRLIPQSTVHGLPVSPLFGGPPLSAGEGSRVGRELLRNWGEALAYCQLKTTSIWEDGFDPSSGMQLFGSRRSIMSENAILEILAVLDVADREYAKDPRLNAPSKGMAVSSSSVNAPSQAKATSKGKSIRAHQVGESETMEPDKKKTKWNKGGQEVDAPAASPPLSETRTSRANSRSSSSSLRGLPIPLAGEATTPLPLTLDHRGATAAIARSPSPITIPSIPLPIDQYQDQLQDQVILPEVTIEASNIPIDPPSNVMKSQIEVSSNYEAPPFRPSLPAPPVEPWQRFAPPIPETSARTFHQSSVSRPASTSTKSREADAGYISRIIPSPDQTRYNHIWGSQPQVSHYRQSTPVTLNRSSTQSSIHPNYQAPSYALNAIVAVASQAANVERVGQGVEFSRDLNMEEERWGSSDGSQGKISRFDESSTRGKEETPASSIVRSESISDHSNRSTSIIEQTYSEPQGSTHLSVDGSMQKLGSVNIISTSKSPSTSTFSSPPYSSSLSYPSLANYPNRYNSPGFKVQLEVAPPPLSHNPSDSFLPRPQFTESNIAGPQIRQQSWNPSTPNYNGSVGFYGVPYHSSSNNPSHSTQLSQAYYSPQVPFTAPSYERPNQTFQPSSYANYNQPTNMPGSSNFYNSVPSSYSSTAVPYNDNPGNRPYNNYQQHFPIPTSSSQQQEGRRMDYPAPSSFNPNIHSSRSTMNYSTATGDSVHSNPLIAVDPYGRSSGTRNSNLVGSTSSSHNFGSRNDYEASGEAIDAEDVTTEIQYQKE